jgi:hypothetical protein
MRKPNTLVVSGDLIFTDNASRKLGVAFMLMESVDYSVRSNSDKQRI